MSNTDESKAANDLMDAVSLFALSWRGAKVEEKQTFTLAQMFDLSLCLQMDETMKRLQEKFQTISEELESRHILLAWFLP